MQMLYMKYMNATADTQICAKGASTLFCAPTSQSVRTAGSRWCAAACCRLMKSPVRTPSCALLAHEHLLSVESRVCKQRRRMQRCNNSAIRRINSRMCAAAASNTVCCALTQRSAQLVMPENGYHLHAHHGGHTTGVSTHLSFYPLLSFFLWF